MEKKYIYKEGDLCGVNWELTTLIAISSSMNQSTNSYNDEKYGCGFAKDHIFYQQNNILKLEKGLDNAHYFVADKESNNSFNFNDYKYIAIEYSIDGDDSQTANCEVTINGQNILSSNKNTNRTIAKVEIPSNREYSYDPTIFIGIAEIKSENCETKKLKIYNIWLETESTHLNNLTDNFLIKFISKIKQELFKKVDKEEGKGLSTNDYSTEDKDKVAKIDNIESSVKEIEKKISDSPDTPSLPSTTGKQYGVRLYKNSSDPTLERVGDAVGLIANVGVDTTTVTNDFDNIYPWSKRRQCNLSIDGEVLAYKGEPNFATDGSNGMVMVETPIFYQKYVETDEYIEYWICDTLKEGYRVSPRFIKKDGTMLEKIYVGAYEAGYDSTLTSVSGVTPATNQGRETARDRAKNIGSGWGIVDIAYRCDVLFYLFTIEFATLNSQSIMAGITMSTKQNTGLSDEVASSSGSSSSNTDRTSAFVYRGEENCWGNIWEWIDGCNIKDYQAWVCSNPEDYVDDKFESPYQKLSYINSSTDNSFTKEMGHDDNIPYCCLPTTGGASSSTYYCDNYWCSAGNKALIVGGSSVNGYSAGLCYWSCNFGFDASDATIGARISYKPS